MNVMFLLYGFFLVLSHVLWRLSGAELTLALLEPPLPLSCDRISGLKVDAAAKVCCCSSSTTCDHMLSNQTTPQAGTTNSE